MNEMFILNRNEDVVAVLSGNPENSGCHFFNSKLTLEINKGASLTFEVDMAEDEAIKHVKEENLVIVNDGENYRLLIIKEVSDIHEDDFRKEVYCEDASIELIDEVIYDEVEGKIEMGIVLASILKGTRWAIGEVDNTYIRNLKPEFKLKSVLGGIYELAKQYNAEVNFTVDFAGNKITSRKVHMKTAFGRTLGKRLEFGKDLTSIKRIVNTSDIKTAIVPFGKTNEETGETLTIQGVSWSIPTNSLNKPLGQTFLEDVDATEQWGYKGTTSKKRPKWIAIKFEDCEDENELINLANLQLKRFSKPKVSYEASGVDLYRLLGEEYAHEKVGLGDLASIIDFKFVPELALSSRVVKLELDLNDASNSIFTLGDVVESIVDKDLKTQIEELNVRVGAISEVDLSDIEDRLSEVESSTGTGAWEQVQAINQLLFGTSVGYHYMDESNGIWVFDKPVTEQPTKAVVLKGGIIGLAKWDTQLQEWEVGTFIDGTSVNASLITTGVLKADRIEANALTVNHLSQELKTVINSVGGKADRTEVTTAIKTAVDGISLSVSSNYSTKEETSSGITTAKADAISTASSDATAKVTSAKTELNTAIGKKANSTDVYTKTQTYTKTETDSAIKVSKDAIELGVSTNYETKTNVDTKVSTAKTEAISSASTDASSKVDSAKTELNTAIGKKANITDVYTKTEVYTKAQTDSAISVSKDAINLTVSGTYETKTNVDTKVSTAKTDAISSSNTYADTKKSEAIATASADATSKVTSAKTELNTAIGTKANASDVYTKTQTYTKTETDSAIKVSKDAIELGVSNTYETKTSVDTKVSTAKTGAISSANSSTDTKLQSYSTTTQMNTAITLSKDAIESNVSQTYLSKGDATNTYATSSKLTQTANDITASFKASGGYNLIKNSTGYNDIALWLTSGATMGTATNNNIGGATTKYMYLDNGTKTSESYAFSTRFNLKANTKYTLSGWVSNDTKCPNFDVFILTSTAVGESDTSQAYTSAFNIFSTQTTSGVWKKFSGSFTTPAGTLSGILRVDNNGYNSAGTGANRVYWSALILNEGEEQPWTPHPSELYDGSTIIDSSGVTVKNGALRIQNNAGLTVLNGDSNGNLVVQNTLSVGGSTDGNIQLKNSGNTTIFSASKNGLFLKDGIMKVTTGAINWGSIGSYPSGATRDMTVYAYGLNIDEVDTSGSQTYRRNGNYYGGNFQLTSDNTGNAGLVSYRNYQDSRYLLLQKANGNLSFSNTIKLDGDAGSINSTTITADRIYATSNGQGTNFQVGDDVWLGDVNESYTMSIKGVADSSKGYIRFGNGGKIGYNTGKFLDIYSPLYVDNSITVKGGVSVGGADFVDSTDNSPWYGIGKSSLNLGGDGSNSAVQVAGYYGLRLRSSASYLDLRYNTYNTYLKGHLMPADSRTFWLGTNSPDNQWKGVCCEGGTVGASDIRSKENIQRLDGAIVTYNELSEELTEYHLVNLRNTTRASKPDYYEFVKDRFIPTYYNYKLSELIMEETGEYALNPEDEYKMLKNIGFIAQDYDLENDKVAQEFIYKNEDGSLAYNHMSYVTVGMVALQEATRKIEALESENNELRTEIEKIKKHLGI